MKSAKIGQLTPVIEPLLPIDRCGPHNPLSQPLPVAVQPAWLCRHDQTLGDEGAGEYNCLHVCHKLADSVVTGGGVGNRRNTEASRYGDVRTDVTKDRCDNTEGTKDKDIKTKVFTCKDIHSEERRDDAFNTEPFKDYTSTNTEVIKSTETNWPAEVNKDVDLKTDIDQDRDINIELEETVSILNADPHRDLCSETFIETSADIVQSAHPRSITPPHSALPSKHDKRSSTFHLNHPLADCTEINQDIVADVKIWNTSEASSNGSIYPSRLLPNSYSDTFYLHHNKPERRPLSFIGLGCDRVRRTDFPSLCTSCSETSGLCWRSRCLVCRRHDQECGRFGEVKMTNNEGVYVNDLDKSPAASDVSLSCSCRSQRREQILSVHQQEVFTKRLSHQYLNSSVTGRKHPFIFSDTGHVDAPGFQAEMIFNAARSKERVDVPGTEELNHAPSLHHYYNKNCMFQNSGVDKNFRNDKGEKKKPKDFDLSLFIPLSQMKCPFSKFSHSPQHKQKALPSTKYQPFNNQDHKLLLNQDSGNYLLAQQLHTGSAANMSFGSFSQSSLIQHLTCGTRRISISPISLLWAFLSVLVSATCLLSFLTPFWAVHPDHIHSFGLLNLCVRDQRFSNPRSICVNFGYQQMYSFRVLNNETEIFPYVVDTPRIDITRIPSGAWQAACLLFGAGVGVQILGAIVSLVVLTLSEPWHRRVALCNGYMQTVGVLLLLSGLLLYPVGFGSPFFSYFCESSRAFCTGHCALGWSYITAVMATALSIFCPVISNFAEAQINKEKKALAVHLDPIGPRV